MQKIENFPAKLLSILRQKMALLGLIRPECVRIRASLNARFGQRGSRGQVYVPRYSGCRYRE